MFDPWSGRKLRSHMPHSQKTKIKNRSNIVINSIKDLKIVNFQKKILKKKKKNPYLSKPTCANTKLFW